jgi:signal transduction histidine kinase
MKQTFIKYLSIGVFPHLSDSKKLAIQAATFDGYSTILTMFFYFIYINMIGDKILAYWFLPGMVLMSFGLWLLSKQKYDVGRYLLHMVSLAQIAVMGDAAGVNSGVEFYYFTSLIVPFVTFTQEERKKGLTLSTISCVVLIAQQYIGTGLIFGQLPISHLDKLVSLIICCIFIMGFLAIARWQIYLAVTQIQLQQSELIHASNLKALGEMAGGIAHEINNPLQTLSLQSRALKSSFTDLKSIPPLVSEQLDTVESTITRIAKLVKGLRDLTRDVANDPVGYFLVKEALEDVMSVSSERMKNLGIKLDVVGDTDLAISGHMVQISQVLINLLNNSIDALNGLENKWISIEIVEVNNNVRIIVTDSGPAIPKAIAEKLMMPFFTTKGPGKGTGLGLSISKSIIERNGGKFYLETRAAHTQFVMELPGVTETA